jgi:hypothetical protein
MELGGVDLMLAGLGLLALLHETRHGQPLCWEGIHGSIAMTRIEIEINEGRINRGWVCGDRIGNYVLQCHLEIQIPANQSFALIYTH